MLAIYSMIAVQIADLDFVPFWASWRNGKSYQFRDRHRDYAKPYYTVQTARISQVKDEKAIDPVAR